MVMRAIGSFHSLETRFISRGAGISIDGAVTQVGPEVIR